MRHSFYYLFVIILIAIFSISCKEQTPPKPTFNHIKDEQARKIIEQSIQTHGGLEAWKNMKTLHYTKDFALFDADGNQESFTKQVHAYDYAEKKFTITTNSKRGETILVSDNGQLSKTKDKKATDDTQQQLQKSINTSMYVVSIPFKLLDPGVSLKYVGKETLDNNKTAYVIEAVYNVDTHDNHSTNDTWWYYFEETDKRVIANKVKTHDHDAFIDNLSFVTEGGILFNGHRKSYRLDSLGNKDYLRAEYFYDNYKVEH